MENLILSALLADTSSSESEDEVPFHFFEKKKKRNPKVDYVERIVPMMSYTDFRSHFRLSKATTDILVNELSQVLRFNVVKPLLMTLWILATPDSFRSVANRFGVYKSTLWLNCGTIWKLLAKKSPISIRWPNLSEMQRSQEAFRQKAAFPGVIGCIDGTHISIKAPHVDPEAYVNRKDFFSIILQAVVNEKLAFIDCYVGECGSVHDARVFRKSKLGQDLLQRIPENYHLLGDMAYPISRNLLTPFRNNGHLTSREVNYNIKFSKTKSTVERAFALLKGRFRRLKYLDMSRTNLIPIVIMACCVLHNICIYMSDFINLDDNDYSDDDNDDGNNDVDASSNSYTREGIEKRFQIMKSLS